MRPKLFSLRSQIRVIRLQDVCKLPQQRVLEQIEIDIFIIKMREIKVNAPRPAKLPDRPPHPLQPLNFELQDDRLQVPEERSPLPPTLAIATMIKPTYRPPPCFSFAFASSLLRFSSTQSFLQGWISKNYQSRMDIVETGSLSSNSWNLAEPRQWQSPGASRSG